MRDELPEILDEHLSGRVEEMEYLLRDNSQHVAHLQFLTNELYPFDSDSIG